MISYNLKFCNLTLRKLFCIHNFINIEQHCHWKRKIIAVFRLRPNMRAKLLILLLTLSAAISTLAEENLQNCPDESWIYFNNFCYKIVTQKRTFQHAEQECAKLNAELFFPPSGKIVLTIPQSKEFWIDTTLRKNPVWINNPTLDPIQSRTWLSAHGIFQEFPCTYPKLGIMQNN
ncbi:hypothetical protein T11_2788 [Trichinella zimbabwensis]|uniref:C-type lectin domain-containing protein n=1 Tax=Trichinella zimbabwensis TaxID=268475 RepID=A0A0V1HLF6_9BILA|nr:hypothetical protein T11_2788 [Trichinella zimbabwensis]